MPELYPWVPNTIIAGGYATFLACYCEYTDIDIWACTAEAYEEVLGRLGGTHNRRIFTGHQYSGGELIAEVTNVTREGRKPVQVILAKGFDMHYLLTYFDLDVCQVATDGQNLYATARAHKALAHHQLLNRGGLVQPRRLDKYVKKGFKYDQEQATFGMVADGYVDRYFDKYFRSCPSDSEVRMSVL